MPGPTALALSRVLLDSAAASLGTAPEAEPDGAPQLTAREREVAVLIARGLKDREIAGTLVMGRATASWHVRNVLSKLGLSRAQVGVWALQKGLLNT
jgi:DNA-binding NarL/FixJ family response regulator